MKLGILYGEIFFLLTGRWVLPVGGYCMVLFTLHMNYHQKRAAFPVFDQSPPSVSAPCHQPSSIFAPCFSIWKRTAFLIQR
ncbi:hypothetical protein HZ326_19413 [Fusarium oxysporum f. sp. albedinis]|nr:hypothetical protein HZ326_19413 [Fusarium oxysporum f. sp. albedinis]